MTKIATYLIVFLASITISTTTYAHDDSTYGEHIHDDEYERMRNMSEEEIDEYINELEKNHRHHDGHEDEGIEEIENNNYTIENTKSDRKESARDRQKRKRDEARERRRSSRER